MNNRSVNFGPVWGMSGIEGFFGEGYDYHSLFKPFGLTFDGMTFVAKTTTLPPRIGNMPLSKANGITPIEFKPKCIVVKPIAGVTLNAVALSGPGAKFLLHQNKWQKFNEPFQISFMAVGQTREERVEELHQFCILLKSELPRFLAPIGLQLNYSCPNTGHEMATLQDEIYVGLDIVEALNIPIVVKINLLMPPPIISKISRHPACWGICVSNSIPFGEMPDEIDWIKLFGTKDKNKSPLAKYGGGGLSGKPLLPMVAKYVHELRKLGMQKHINAGGGILSGNDVRELRDAGASSVSIGSITMLRPWRVQRTINAAHWFFGKGKYE